MAQFKPIKCTEAQMNSKAKREGQLFFCTDTNKIYLDESSSLREEYCKASESSGTSSKITYKLLSPSNLTMSYNFWNGDSNNLGKYIQFNEIPTGTIMLRILVQCSLYEKTWSAYMPITGGLLPIITSYNPVRTPFYLRLYYNYGKPRLYREADGSGNTLPGGEAYYSVSVHALILS